MIGGFLVSVMGVSGVRPSPPVITWGFTSGSICIGSTPSLGVSVGVGCDNVRLSVGGCEDWFSDLSTDNKIK